MAKFEEFSKGFTEVFDRRPPKQQPLIKKGIITRGSYEGLPVSYKDGLAGVDIFGRWFPLEEKDSDK